LQAIDVRIEERVVHATLDAPPPTLIGPELVRDLIEDHD
jgi:hypothetical protein